MGTILNLSSPGDCKALRKIVFIICAVMAPLVPSRPSEVRDATGKADVTGCAHMSQS